MSPEIEVGLLLSINRSLWVMGSRYKAVLPVIFVHPKLPSPEKGGGLLIRGTGGGGSNGVLVSLHCDVQ